MEKPGEERSRAFLASLERCISAGATNNKPAMAPALDRIVHDQSQFDSAVRSCGRFRHAPGAGPVVLCHRHGDHSYRRLDSGGTSGAVEPNDRAAI